jgi:hypothetical protein
MVEQIIKLLQEHEKALGRYLEEKPEDWINNFYANISRQPPSYLADRNAISLGTEIFKHTNDVAVVIATCRTAKGTFRGVGVASERNQNTEHGILELAQTKAIARSLRLAGYYVKCCSAEEVLLLKDRKNTQTRRGHDPKPKSIINPKRGGAGGI